MMTRACSTPIFWKKEATTDVLRPSERIGPPCCTSSAESLRPSAWRYGDGTLLRSAFPHLTLHGVTVARTLSVDDIYRLSHRRAHHPQRAPSGARRLRLGYVLA